MAGNASIPTNHNLYDVWPETASNGKTYWKARVPSKRGEATIILLDWYSLDEQSQAVIRDPAQMPEWKPLYFELAYEQFREYENARKHAASVEFNEAIKVDTPATTSPMWLTISTQEASVESEDTVEQILSQVSAKVAERIRLKVLGDLSFVDIARLENPGATEAEIATAANSIGRSVTRGLKRLREVLENQCPVSGSGEDV